MGVGYNYREALKYIKNKEAHEASLVEALDRYFAGGQNTDQTDFGPFFCSELVVACYINSGFIHPSAAVVISPGTYAPADLAREPTFGYLVGFLAFDPNTEIPADDPMMCMARYSNIVGCAVTNR